MRVFTEATPRPDGASARRPFWPAVRLSVAVNCFPECRCSGGRWLSKWRWFSVLFFTQCPRGCLRGVAVLPRPSLSVQHQVTALLACSHVLVAPTSESDKDSNREQRLGGAEKAVVTPGRPPKLRRPRGKGRELVDKGSWWRVWSALSPAPRPRTLFTSRFRSRALLLLALSVCVRDGRPLYRYLLRFPDFLNRFFLK